MLDEDAVEHLTLTDGAISLDFLEPFGHFFNPLPTPDGPTKSVFLARLSGLLSAKLVLVKGAGVDKQVAV